MDNYMNIISGRLSKLLDKRVSVPISDDLLLGVLTRTKVKNVTIEAVTITDEIIMISGRVKKAGLSIPCAITLAPSETTGRTVYFDVIKTKPLNMKWIHKSIFNRPPHITYDKGEVGIDLNQITIVERIPVGRIKGFTVKEGVLVVEVGV
ncbi:hypothetical protein [Alteribacter keqinensis]|uniref:Uncharacterized protein n=1 Tax=Alteribacter keqinensis TaxID=2483800 RepID=A0A3M7TQE4_9BACI|nr:hypothetical protein [Alteribacter keqinensis]RNA67641.1 hypothetical protein EBO34_13030 [Alteribacter keqinensis]